MVYGDEYLLTLAIWAALACCEASSVHCDSCWRESGRVAAAASPPSLPNSFSTARIAAPAAGLMSALRLSCPGVFPTSSPDTCNRPARYAAAPAHAAPSIVLAGRSSRALELGPRPSSRVAWLG